MADEDDCLEVLVGVDALQVRSEPPRLGTEKWSLGILRAGHRPGGVDVKMQLNGHELSCHEQHSTPAGACNLSLDNGQYLSAKRVRRRSADEAFEKV